MPGAFTTASGHRSQAEQTPAARRVDVPAGSGWLLRQILPSAAEGHSGARVLRTSDRAGSSA